jgi:hypothetical protein
MVAAQENTAKVNFFHSCAAYEGLEINLGSSSEAGIGVMERDVQYVKNG